MPGGPSFAGATLVGGGGASGSFGSGFGVAFACFTSGVFGGSFGGGGGVSFFGGSGFFFASASAIAT